MPRRTTNADAARQDEVYRCLAHYRRRRILAILAQHESPLPEPDLANHISAAESPAKTAGDRREEIKSLRIELRHVHLPALSDAGLVDWDPDEEAVARADHPSLHDADVVSYLGRLDASWDPFVSALAHRYRRLALSITSQRGEAVERAALACSIVERERERGVDATVDEVLASLHHTHFPALDDAGLLEYDRDAGTVTFRGHPEVEDDWFAADMDERDPTGPSLARVPL